MGFSQAPGLPYSKLGIPEDGDTASQAISKGKYVIWKGKNYFAKTDILQGETFVEDTNLTEIPDGALNGIADALNASLIYVDSDSISFSCEPGLSTTYYTVQIPDGYTPIAITPICTGWAGTRKMVAAISEDGRAICVHNGGSATRTWSGYVRYVCMKT